MLLITICHLIWNFLKFKYHKIIHSGGLLGSLLSKLAGTLIKAAVPLAKNILAPLGRTAATAAAAAIDAGIKKKNKHGFEATTLITSNEEMNDIMKIDQALEGYNILLKGATRTIKNGTKEQKGVFLSMLLGIGIAGAGYRNKMDS